MSKKYINNLETGHIELHFEKSEYQALSAEQKKEIKGAYLWSRYASAWVSRSTKNHYTALRVAEKLGFTAEEKQGERLSFAEEMEIKAAKAEHRADRYEYKAEKAIATGEQLQSELNSFRGDTAFFTQPIIAGHAGSQAFARRRERIYDRYHKGMEEYRKSEHYQDRAETARQTASMSQLKDPVYLDNRIKEQNSTIKKLQSNIVNYENKLYRIEQGEELKNYKGEILTIEQYQKWIDETLDKMEYEIDKLSYFENALEEIGGNRFSKENVKVGYIVKLRRWGNVEITSTGPKNIQYKILTGGAAGLGGVEPYAAIIEITEAKEAKKATLENPFNIGDLVVRNSIGGDRIIYAYQVVKVTAKTITIQEIEIKNNKPLKDSFISDKQERKTVKQDRQKNYVVNDGSWYLYQYVA